MNPAAGRGFDARRTRRRRRRPCRPPDRQRHQRLRVRRQIGRVTITFPW